VVARLDGSVGGLPRLRFQWSTDAGVWAEATLLEAPFPLGPIGSAPALARRRFLADRRFDPAVRLSRNIDGHSVLDIRDIGRSDWLPGTVASIYGTDDPAELLRREHTAHAVTASGTSAHPGDLPAAMPLLRSDIAVDQDGEVLRARTLDLGLDIQPVRDWWADWFGQTSWPTEDLYYGLIEKFVRHVIIEDPEAFAGIRGRPALFLANHQTAVESLLFSIVVSALIETPTVTVAKIEHKDTWLGHLIRQGFSWPGVADPQVITYFDRADKASLMGVIAQLHHGLTSRDNPRSAMVHVEGTRSFDCTEPVQIMSGKFIDLALEADAPIIPVRFSGGLPRQPLQSRTEFPIGMGRQDIWLGRPLSPAELAPMPYGERKKAVLKAMNALGPSPAQEQPLPPDPDFAARVEAWRAHVGCSEEHATLWIALQDIPEPSGPIRRLLAGADLGALRVASTEEDRWLAVLAKWVYGDRGPSLVE